MTTTNQHKTPAEKPPAPKRAEALTDPTDTAPPVDQRPLTGPTPPAAEGRAPAYRGGDAVRAGEVVEYTLAGRPKPPVAGVKVRATQIGYYDDKRRRVGDVFVIDGTLDDRETLSAPDDPSKTWKNPKFGQVAAFSTKWMELVDPSTPERITTGQQALRQQHDEILGGRLAEQGATPPASTRTTGDTAVLED